ncbi:putative ABC transporter, permease protein [Desulfonema limicola]|uniref:ABC transporter, permease protein n=1 Tax=Desulfonema limicola TaxID=45656 RepID=A0A975B3Y3_9BACT|nr:ABC transporter permease [Desulfonema limicola]QTA78349.1 putative ABC transporter, permease protein [Desulfonema limicola]
MPKDTQFTGRVKRINSLILQALIPQAFIPWIIPFLFILIWFTASENQVFPSYLVPHPFDIAKTGYFYIFGKTGEIPFSGRFLQDALSSLNRVFLGFFLSAVLGIPLGIVSGRVKNVHRLLSTSINGLRAVPGISWLPLALVWFGIGIKTTVFLIASASFFPVYLNAVSGSRQVNPLLLQAGAMMGVSSTRGIFHILIPAAMPHLVTGLRLGLGISWAYLVLGELTGVPRGLGAVIMDARMIGRIDIIIVGIIIIAALGRASDLLLCILLKLCFKSARRIM